MLEKDNCYRDNKGKELVIGGRIKKYSEETPWVWSICGNWYNERTGAFVSYGRVKGSPGEFKHTECDVDASMSISDHNPISKETSNA